MTATIDNNLSENESLLDEVLPVSPELVAEIVYALEVGDKDHIDYLLEPLHNADIADVFEQLNDNHRRQLTSFIGSELDHEVLSELDDGTLDDVIAEMDDEDVARAVSQMESDDAIHVLEDMDEDEQRKIIDALPDEDRLVVEEGLSYPEESAGRLLQRKLVSVPGQWSVGKVIDHFRTENSFSR
jgi:magnesium transporter